MNYQSRKHNVLIIGAGPGGYVAAIRGAQLGLSVCVVEKNNVGGVCLNLGCIPTKAALKESEFLRQVRHQFQDGIKMEEQQLWEMLVESSRKPVETLRSAIEHLFKQYGVELIKGEGVFEDGKIVIKTDGGVIVPLADNVIIATGSKNAVIKGFEPDHERVITSDDVFCLKSLPARIAIIGGGAIGSEFATLFSGLSREIHLIEMMPHILPFLDDDISGVVEREFKKSKLNLHTGVQVESFTKGDSLTLRLSNGKNINVDCVLVATGRKPNTAFLSGLGVDMDYAGRIKVDASMRTNIPHLFAIGDCVGQMMLAHTASEEGIVAVETIAGREKEMDYSAIPVTVFTTPEVAYVGLTERGAKEKEIEIKTSSVLYRSIGRAHADNLITGKIKLVIRQDGIVLGGEMVGKNATEIVHTIALAVKQGIHYKELQDMIFAHPTYSELIREVADSFDNMAIHSGRR